MAACAPRARSSREPARLRWVVLLAATAAGLVARHAAAGLAAVLGPGVNGSGAAVQVLGHVRGRLVIAFVEGLEGLAVHANGTKLRRLKDNRWRAQDKRYGERFCSYAEFRLPPLPAEVRVIGRMGHRIFANETFWLAAEAVPEAALWQEKYMLKAAPEWRALQGAPERPALSAGSAASAGGNAGQASRG